MNNEFALVGVFGSIVDFSVEYLSRIGLTLFPQDYITVGAHIVNNGYYKVVYSEQLFYFYKNGYYGYYNSAEDFVEKFIESNKISANKNSLPFDIIVNLMEDRELFYFSHNEDNQVLVTDTCLKEELIDLNLDCIN